MIRLTKPIKRTEADGDKIQEIVSLAQIGNSENWKFSLHRHKDFCELIFIVSGRGEYTVNEKEYQVQSGDLVLVNQGAGHMQTSSPDAPLIAWNLSLRVSARGDLPENHLILDQAPAVVFTGQHQDTIKQCCEEIFREMSEKQEGYCRMALIWAERYLLLAERLLPQTLLPENPEGGLAWRVKAYLDENFNQIVTLDTLEEIFHVNKYHIAHELKRVYQISPIRYAIDRRLGEAQNLLCCTKQPVTEIAKEVGYDNVHYFNRLFQKRFGMTPTEFRRQYINME